MTKDTNYATARRRLDELVSVTGVGGTIRIRKDDLLAVLDRLDEGGPAITSAQVRVAAITLFQDYDSQHGGAKVDDFMDLARRVLEAARDAS